MSGDPTCWQAYPVAQAIDYGDPILLSQCIAELNELPPLVTWDSVQQCQADLIRAQQGELFILQAGDCAERFTDCTAERVQTKLGLLQSLAQQLSQQLAKPVRIIGRMAGQYAKPRSAPFETQDGKTLPSYRGDLVNAPSFSACARQPDPRRMLAGYYSAAAVLAHCQHHVAPVWVSHEALNLYYEAALTRQSPGGQWFNAATHFPWLGLRSGDIDGAHVAYFSGIANPMAIKIGPKTSLQWLIEITQRLNPRRLPGRLTLTYRLGCEFVTDFLPALIDAMQTAAMPVLWCCDPMHGNTQVNDAGRKQRLLTDILSELEQAQAIHRQTRTIFGGVHLELTPDPVHECEQHNCMGEPATLQLQESLVDPRLNPLQAQQVCAAIV